MRQIRNMKDDSFQRIQEEINAETQREREFQRKLQLQMEMTGGNSPNSVEDRSLDSSSYEDEFLCSPSSMSNSFTNSKEMFEQKTGTLVDDDNCLNGKSTSTSTSTSTTGTVTNTIGKNGFRKENNSSSIIFSPQKVMAKNAFATASSQRIFNQNPQKQKGIMQRFIASKGKLDLLNSKRQIKNGSINGDHLAIATNTVIPSDVLSKIERDSDGKLIRPGYVAVEDKIQMELSDIKNREKELRTIRRSKHLQSQPDLLSLDDSDNSDSGNEYDYRSNGMFTKKLKPSKSISELSEHRNEHTNIFERSTSSYSPIERGGPTLRPAKSLAQLCDLDPEETPSSHKLIQQWESIIQKFQKLAN